MIIPVVHILEIFIYILLSVLFINLGKMLGFCSCLLMFIVYISFFSMVSLVVMTLHINFSPALILGLLKKLLLALPSRATFCMSQVQMLNISFFIFPYSYLINERRKITKPFCLTICGILSYGNHKIYKLATLNATYYMEF